jgi:G3E family GTPase
VPLDAVLGRNAFDLDRILKIEPAFLEEEEHDDHAHHDHGHDHDAHDHHDHAHHGHDDHGHKDHGHDDHGHKPHNGKTGGLKHYHDEEMQSLSLHADKPLNADVFFPWIQEVAANDGLNILRLKGILSFKDDDERFVIQGVHMILDGDHQRAWREDEKRESRLVFIGRHLPQERLRKGFDACIA